MEFGTFFSRKKSPAPSVLSVAENTSTKAETGLKSEGNSLFPNIELTEMCSRFLPGVDEAAMLYANGQIDETINFIRDLLKQRPEDDCLWTMLFDLYILTQQAAAFEDLSMAYVREREKSPPIYPASTNQDQQTLPPSTVSASIGELTLSGQVDHAVAESLNKIVAAKNISELKIDFSAVTGLTTEGAHLLQQGLIALRQKLLPMQVACGSLMSLLKTQTERVATTDPEYFLLLLELYQLVGKETLFENLALDYASHFEMSPPPWVPYAQSEEVLLPVPTEQDLQHTEKTDPNCFALHGVINAHAQAQLDDFISFCQPHTEACLDMADVPRIDFVSIGMLMNTFMHLTTKRKKISIINTNSLVYVLLYATGVDQLTNIVLKASYTGVDNTYSR